MDRVENLVEFIWGEFLNPAAAPGAQQQAQKGKYTLSTHLIPAPNALAKTRTTQAPPRTRVTRIEKH